MIHPDEIGFINGSLAKTNQSLHSCHSLEQLKKLARKIRSYGGEMELVRVADILSESRSWNNCYVARLPYYNVSLVNRSFQDNYLA
jgi:hypothetical protein